MISEDRKVAAVVEEEGSALEKQAKDEARLRKASSRRFKEISRLPSVAKIPYSSNKSSSILNLVRPKMKKSSTQQLYPESNHKKMAVGVGLDTQKGDNGTSKSLSGGGQPFSDHY
jgi:hypothetical protein